MAQSDLDQFYQAYKDSGIRSELVALHGMRWLIALAGMALDLALVLVTVRTKTLQGPCNLLLAFVALSSAIFQLGPSVTLYLTFSGHNFVPLAQCFLLQSAPILAISTSICATLLVGLDRLLCVARPIWHKKLSNGTHKWAYLSGLAAVSQFYALSALYVCWRVCQLFADLPVMCTVNVDCYQGWSNPAMFSSAFIPNLFTVVVYIALWSTIRWKSSSGDSLDPGTRRILKSVTLLFLTTILGWSFTCLSRLFLPLLPISVIQRVFLANVLGYVTNLTAASSMPVLFICSDDYRRAMLAIFGKKEAAPPLHSLTPIQMMPMKKAANN